MPDGVSGEPAAAAHGARSWEVAAVLAGGYAQTIGRFQYFLADQRWVWSDEVARMHGYEPGQVLGEAFGAGHEDVDATVALTRSDANGVGEVAADEHANDGFDVVAFMASPFNSRHGLHPLPDCGSGAVCAERQRLRLTQPPCGRVLAPTPRTSDPTLEARCGRGGSASWHPHRMPTSGAVAAGSVFQRGARCYGAVGLVSAHAVVAGCPKSSACSA